MKSPQSTPSRARLTALATLVAVAAVGFASVVAELSLRVIAPRGITFHSYHYDAVTGGTLYPNSKVLYRDAAGRVIRRDVNSWGYLDNEHTPAKPAGTYRIGFFGDSYTEARQVELEETFFRLIDESANARLRTGLRLPNDDGRVDRIETIAFGISGRSAVQSMLDCRQRMGAFDLNCVVYVMFDNDPRDQLKAVRRENNFPYATAVGDSFALDYSARDFFAKRDTGPRRAWQRIKAKSLVLSTIDHRLKLLRQYGIHPNVAEVPLIHPNTAPSTWWSDEQLTEAEHVHANVVRSWRDKVEQAGRTFIVLYMPWEHSIHDPLENQDSWRPWLHAFAQKHAVRLVDPTDCFVDALDHGHNPFGDHLTPAGHECVAAAFTAYFIGP